MLYVILTVVAAIFFMTIKQYMPVKDVPYQNIKRDELETEKVIVDLRDYNIAAKSPSKGSINIPVAYLNRYYEEIPSKKVHIIVHDQIEKNIGVRLLRKKGIKVTSYSVSNYQC